MSTWATSYLINGIIGLVLYALMKLVPPFGHGAIHQVPNALHAGLVIIMCSITLQKFKRQQEVCNKALGREPVGRRAKPRVRPAFEGLPMTSVVNGKIELDFPDWWRRGRQTIAWSIIAVLLWADMAVVTDCANVLKHQKDEQIRGLANNHLSILIAMCQVQGVNALGSILARILTKYENWKTDEEYAHHLTMKDVIFQLINTFFPQFWVAFIEPVRYDDDKMCPPTNNCKGELSFQIAVLFAGQAGYSLAKQAVLPIVLRFLSQRRIRRWAARTIWVVLREKPTRTGARRRARILSS